MLRTSALVEQTPAMKSAPSASAARVHPAVAATIAALARVRAPAPNPSIERTVPKAASRPLRRRSCRTLGNLWQLEPFAHLLLANAVLVVHVGIAAFVVVGLLLVVVGNFEHWSWVNNAWFRISHVAAIGIVVAESWLGFVCPLTTLEMWLRSRAGEESYGGGFIEHWLQQLLYYSAPLGSSLWRTPCSPCSYSPPGGTSRHASRVAFMNESPNPSIERTAQSPLRGLWSAAHVER